MLPRWVRAPLANVFVPAGYGRKDTEVPVAVSRELAIMGSFNEVAFSGFAGRQS